MDQTAGWLAAEATERVPEQYDGIVKVLDSAAFEVAKPIGEMLGLEEIILEDFQK